MMKSTVATLIALAVCCGCQPKAPEAKTETDKSTTAISVAQSGLAPIAGTTYRVIVPPKLYETHQPGPKGQATSQAWSLANEFVFRTALRETCILPSEKVIPHKIGYMVVFKHKNGDRQTRIFVNADLRTLEMKE